MLPKKFWRVSLVNGTSSKLRYAERGGQTYAQEKAAQNRVDSLRRRGIECVLYVSEPVVWHAVDDSPIQVNGQEALPFD